MTTQMPATFSSPFPALLRERRRARSLSQDELAALAETSQRHLSYLESGKARPSRVMVLQLAEALACPLRERNHWLLAAGFAPLFGERPLSNPDMAPVRLALDLMLRQQEPYPATVVDRAWNVVQINRAAERLLAVVGGEAMWQAVCGAGPRNLLKLTFHPKGLRPLISNIDELGPALLARAIAEARECEAAARVLAEVLSFEGIPPRWRVSDAWVPATPVLPTRLSMGGQSLNFITLLASFGMAQDVTTDDLRVECLFPVDASTEQAMRVLAQT